jgi:ubiquinone/menaquinone biosynthesis C-methylase UbiE
LNPAPAASEWTFICPACHGQLAGQQSGLHCRQCGLIFASILDIPDLRHPRPHVSRAEQSRLDRLVASFNELDFSGLLKIFLRDASLSPGVLMDTFEYYDSQWERSAKMTRMFLERNKDAFGCFRRGAALDLGSGAGGGAIALRQSFQRVLAVDSDPAQLILAKKAISESGQMNIQLLVGYAQNLPLPDCSFDYVQCANVIEHLVENLELVILEIRRVLVDQGRFSADSRNRFDLFMPEPHSGIRWLGFLPRRWIPGMVRRMTGNHYRQTRLLSRGELCQAVGQAFPDYSVELPDLDAYGRTGTMSRHLQVLLNQSLINRLVSPIFSAHLVVARKRETAKFKKGGRK